MVLFSKTEPIWTKLRESLSPSYIWCDVENLLRGFPHSQVGLAGVRFQSVPCQATWSNACHLFQLIDQMLFRGSVFRQHFRPKIQWMYCHLYNKYRHRIYLQFSKFYSFICIVIFSQNNPTGETTQAITPFQFFDYLNFFIRDFLNFYHWINFITT